MQTRLNTEIQENKENKNTVSRTIISLSKRVGFWAFDIIFYAVKCCEIARFIIKFTKEDNTRPNIKMKLYFAYFPTTSYSYNLHKFGNLTGKCIYLKLSKNDQIVFDRKALRKQLPTKENAKENT